MARIEDLIDQIADPAVRDEIARQVKLLKSTKRFGLVFEDHVPETVSLFGLPIRSGSIVQNRRTPEDQTRFQVVAVNDETATIVPLGLDEPKVEVAIEDLLVVKGFEEPIFPGLTQVGEIRRGPTDKPAHTVISGENFHALQLLAYTHAGKVDVIYIDPPYNTGARDWKYNNRFVDTDDAYRHSKWLAMMERRLKLARKLLNPENSVLIVAIDENEFAHLAILLDQVFVGCRRQTITSVITPGGTSRITEFARVEEHLLFVFLGDAGVQRTNDSMLGEGGTSSLSVAGLWENMVRRGNGVVRAQRPGQFYPVYLNPDSGRIVEAGEPIPLDADRNNVSERVGLVAVWPIKPGGVEGFWQLGPKSLMRAADGGTAKATFSEPAAQWTIRYMKNANANAVRDGRIITTGYEPNGDRILEIPGEFQKPVTPKTVWYRKSHDASVHGARLLSRLLRGPSFPFPKSLYAVGDALFFVVKDKPNAVILDYFAGSGTTLHAVAMLNAEDDGQRQCILVTNNDVSDAEAKRLNKEGYSTGDPGFEQHGIFESVTKPRVEAAVTGIRPDGKPVEGKYLDQYLPDYSYADGFPENVNFFWMNYLEPDLVELGRQFNAIAPLLWIAAGSVGTWKEWDAKSSWSAPDDSTYAVLFDPSVATAFGSYVEERSEITHVWIVTDSHSAYVEMRAELPAGLEVGQLYRDYLRNFMINAPGALG